MTTTLLNIRNISKRYYINKSSEKYALLNVSLDVFEGETISLLGVNGAGKTTLSSIIASLYPPTGGEIYFKEKPIFDDLPSYRKNIGLCPQYQNLDSSLLLKQNLAFQGKYYGLGKRQIEERIDFLLEKFELGQYKDSKVDVLSGGYKQRFLIAKSLIHNPKIVILDEPTVGLDPQVRHKLWDFIKTLKKEGMTILLTTHYLDEAEELSDRVCVIDEGKIKIIDTPENLKANFKKNKLEDVFLHLLEEGE